MPKEDFKAVSVRRTDADRLKALAERENRSIAGQIKTMLDALEPAKKTKKQ